MSDVGLSDVWCLMPARPKRSGGGSGCLVPGVWLSCGSRSLRVRASTPLSPRDFGFAQSGGFRLRLNVRFPIATRPGFRLRLNVRSMPGMNEIGWIDLEIQGLSDLAIYDSAIQRFSIQRFTI